MTTTWIWGDLDDMIFADSDWEVSQRAPVTPAGVTPSLPKGRLFF